MAQVRVINAGQETRTLHANEGSTVAEFLRENGIDSEGKAVILNGVSVEDANTVRIVQDAALVLAGAVKGGLR